MLTLITLFVVALVGFLAGALIEKRTYEDGWAFLSYSVGAICALAFIICNLTLINKERRFEATIAQYDVITVMAESYVGQDYGNMTSLTEEIVRMNTRIANHKAFYTSPWTGIWYSEKIANLEPIRFRKNPGLKE